MIQKIKLICFRNHLDYHAEISSNFILLSGENGVGKTSVLEAISLFSPGKSFKNCKFDEIISKHQDYCREWGVHIDCEDTNFSTGYAAGQTRKIKQDGELLKSQSDILKELRILWLLPQMENIFNSSSSIRRKFFDRICYNLFPEHAKTVLRYEYHLKSRMKILQTDSVLNHEWLCSIEIILAELSVKIQHIRSTTLEIIKEQLNTIGADFLQPTLSLINSSDCSDTAEICRLFEKYRTIDRRSGRSNFGVHKTDLVVRNHKGCDASYCSTGEQKALLVSLFLAQATAIKKHSMLAPIMLMDEILAYFDHMKQRAILDALTQTASQIWITTTKNRDDLVNYIDNSECTWLSL